MFAKERVQFSFEVDVELSQELIDKASSAASSFSIEETGNPKELLPVEKYLRYRIEIEMLPQSAILRIANESLVALNSSGVPKTETPIFDRKHTHRDLEFTRGMFASNSIFSFLHASEFTPTPPSPYCIAITNTSKARQTNDCNNALAAVN